MSGQPQSIPFQQGALRIRDLLDKRAAERGGDVGLSHALVTATYAKFGLDVAQLYATPEEAAHLLADGAWQACQALLQLMAGHVAMSYADIRQRWVSTIPSLQPDPTFNPVDVQYWTPVGGIQIWGINKEQFNAALQEVATYFHDRRLGGMIHRHNLPAEATTAMALFVLQLPYGVFVPTQLHAMQVGFAALDHLLEELGEPQLVDKVFTDFLEDVLEDYQIPMDW